jgi:NAD(P)-dependent dehydrogenase (short-subunit alcohol dehydrogenase family)
MDAGISGLRALVTGGPTGIGFAIAEGLAQEGANLVLASLSPGAEAAQQLKDLGVGAEWIYADVSSEDGVVSMVESAVQVFGGIDLFVNNAAGSWHEPITKLSSAAWEKTLATNLSACAYGCREVGRHFIEQGHGSILIVGSTAGHVPLYRESAYRVSKAGLKSLMEVVAIELIPYGIRVNMLTPGAFLTNLTKDLPARQMGGPFIPSRRPGKVSELAAAATLLLSDRLSSYTVGAELVVDGGFRLRPMDLLTDEEISALNAL